MKKNILILLIFFLALFKVGHLFYRWIKDNPNKTYKKEIISSSLFMFNEHKLLGGSWVHEEDSLSTIEINYKKWMFLYEGKFDNDDVYQYQIIDTLPKYANTKSKKGKFLILTTKIDTLKYEILTYNDSIMSLMYFPRMKVHNYRRRK